MRSVINRRRLLTTFREMAATYAPSRRERPLAAYVKKRLKGVRPVKEDDTGGRIGGDAGNLFVRIPGEGDAVVLAAHLDAVEPCAGVRIQRRGGYLYSRGDTVLSADDRAAAAVLLELALAADRLPARRPFTILFTVAEDVGLRGASHVNVAALGARAAFVLDASEPPGHLVVAAPASQQFRATFYGRAAHAGIEPEKGVNAIAMAAAAISRMRLGRIDARTTANVGLITGGRATNIVPDRVVVEGETRSHRPAKLIAHRVHITERLVAAAAAFGGRVEVAWEDSYAGYRIAANAWPVALFRRAARKAGLRVKLVAGGGGSDANVFNARGCPAVVVGCGMEKPHSTEERIAVRALYELADLATALVTA